LDRNNLDRPSNAGGGASYRSARQRLLGRESALPDLDVLEDVPYDEGRSRIEPQRFTRDKLKTRSPSVVKLLMFFSFGGNVNTLSEKVKMRMRNHTAIAKALVVAACTLAIALLTIGMGLNSSKAWSDQSTGLNFTPIPSQPAFHSYTGHPQRFLIPRSFAQNLKGLHEKCSDDDECQSHLCIPPNPLTDISECVCYLPGTTAELREMCCSGAVHPSRISPGEMECD
jgi:hypothetical protein